MNEIKNYDLSLVHSIASGKRQEMADRFIKCILTTDAETEYKELLAAVLNGKKIYIIYMYLCIYCIYVCNTNRK